MSIVKSVLVVLVISCAADAFRFGDLGDVVVNQLRKFAHLEPQKPSQQVHQPNHETRRFDREEARRHEEEEAIRHKQAEARRFDQEETARHHDKPHHGKPVIEDQKERLYLLPKDMNHDGKADEQVVVLEKEVIRRVVDEAEHPAEEELMFDDGEFDEHDSHRGKSIFADAGEGHFGAEEPEFCGGKPGAEPEEPEIIQQVNNFDAIAEAILERRLADMQEDHEDEEGHQHHEEVREIFEPNAAHEEERKHERLERKEAPKKPARLTADEAKVWNQKLSEAIKKHRQTALKKDGAKL